MNADIVLVSPQARNIVNLTTFPRRRLYQAQSFEGVASAEPLYCRPQFVLINIDPDKRNWGLRRQECSEALIRIAAGA